MGAPSSEAWRDEALRPPQPAPGGRHEAWQPDEWIDEGELRDEAADAVDRGRTRRGPGREGRARPRRAGTSSPVRTLAEELRAAVPANRVERLEARLHEASRAYHRGNFDDARRLLRPLAAEAPTAASVRQLYGLTLYQLGRWSQARRELEAFRSLTGSTEQHPVLADCARALRRYGEVEELWDELRAASPSAELVAEGRIVAAGALADQGRIEEAIRLLDAGTSQIRRARPHHLRMVYALADLYERAGDLPRARDLFARIAESDPDFVDVDARLRALR
ncbi:MAG TPA: tetratricopeptide repeat protein [Acidimicrobiales bacterium]